MTSFFQRLKTSRTTRSENEARLMTEKIAETSNPYLKGRLEWNYLFGDIMKAKHQWKWAAFLSLSLNVLLLGGYLFMSLQSRFVPYAVNVDHLGNALFAGFLNQEKTIRAIEVNAFLRQYMVNARTVIVDAFAEKRNLDFVYNVSLSSVRKQLDEYYREQNPFEQVKQELVEVQIQSVIQKSARTWQVDWVELHRSLEGHVISRDHFEALMTVAHIPVKNSELLNTNPLSLFIEQLSWAKQT